MVTTHFTLDKQNAAIREYLAAKADFVGAIRLPSDAFKREGTAVVTDIIFLRKRDRGEPARHVDPDWLGIAPLEIDGAEVPVNRYFLNHPDMVLGNWSRKDTLYGEGYSVTGNGDLAGQLKAAIARLPRIRADRGIRPTQDEPRVSIHASAAGTPHHRGQFLRRDDGVIHQLARGRSRPGRLWRHELWAGGAMTRTGAWPP